MKITFKRTDDFTWEAEANGHEAMIKHKYFGSYDYYAVYINEVEKNRFDKLAEARNYGKAALAERA